MGSWVNIPGIRVLGIIVHGVRVRVRLFCFDRVQLWMILFCLIYCVWVLSGEAQKPKHFRSSVGGIGSMTPRVTALLRNMVAHSWSLTGSEAQEFNEGFVH